MIIDILKETLDKNISVAQVTITKDNGSSPRGVGSTMLVGEHGLITGTIGGGAVELRAIEDARRLLNEKKSMSIHYPLEALNMTCGGDIEVFIHVYPVKEEVLILGAGHICQSLVPVLMGMNYHVIVIDHREGIFDQPVFREITCINEPIKEGLKKVEFHKRMNVVIVTHGHEFDTASLRYAITQPHRYIGMIGSQNKLKGCFDKLINEGIPKKQLESVYAPIGLNTGGETPAEIAVSIASEILAVQYKKKPAHLRDMKGVL